MLKALVVPGKHVTFLMSLRDFLNGSESRLGSWQRQIKTVSEALIWCVIVDETKVQFQKLTSISKFLCRTRVAEKFPLTSRPQGWCLNIPAVTENWTAGYITPLLRQS